MSLRLSLTLVVLLSVVCLTLITPCFADGTGTNADPGDPVEELPLCTAGDTLDPTAGTFGEVWMILMAMAFQLAL